MKTSCTRGVYIIFALVVLLSGCGIFSSNDGNPGKPGLPRLTIISQEKTLAISSSFIGLNIEMKQLCSVLQTDATHQQAYEQLFTNLGTGILHVGGHSADGATWQPDGVPVCGDNPVLTKTSVQSLFAFAQRIHWNVIWGLNFLINNTPMIADEAAYVATVGGSSLLGFSIGNEPELFAKHGDRPAAWGLKDYLAEWEANRNAVLAQVPTAKLFGPEACCQNPPWFDSFVQSEGNSKTLVAASRHYYSYSGASPLASQLTAASLLLPKVLANYTLAAREWATTAAQAKIPLDITEINSISNGGIRGISNTFAATLWVTDILCQSALLGVDQMDFQEVPGSAYAPIDAQAVPQPIYYGLLFFHLATVQASLLSSVLNTTENVSACVLKGVDGTLRVVIINKEPQRGIDLTINPGSSYHKVTTLRMQAPSFAPTAKITLGNNAIAGDGTWSMSSPTPQPVQTTQTVLSVPASSAALFTFSV